MKQHEMKQVMESYGYKMLSGSGTFVKYVYDSQNNKVISVMFSNVHGHRPLKLKYRKNGEPVLNWVNVKNRVWIDNNNINMHCKNSEDLIKRYHIEHNNWVIDNALKNI